MKVKAQIDTIYAKKITPEAFKDEAIMEKDMIIITLKEKLDMLRSKETALENRNFELEQRNLVTIRTIRLNLIGTCSGQRKT